jgi:hypothetical protein
MAAGETPAALFFIAVFLYHLLLFIDIIFNVNKNTREVMNYAPGKDKKKYII